MTSLTSDSSQRDAADRARAYRQRKRRQKIQFTIEMTPYEIRALIARGYLSDRLSLPPRHDPAVQAAIEALSGLSATDRQNYGVAARWDCRDLKFFVGRI